MMPFIFWVVGLILIYLEFFIPGAVMGIAGGLLLIASLSLFVITYNDPIWIIVYFLCVGISVGVLIKFALWRIPRVKPEKSIYSSDAQEGYVASAFDASTIGHYGIVLSDLKPGGYILIDGIQHQAISESGYIPQGEEVVVLRGEGDSLIVRKRSDQKE